MIWQHVGLFGPQPLWLGVWVLLGDEFVQAHAIELHLLKIGHIYLHSIISFNFLLRFLRIKRNNSESIFNCVRFKLESSFEISVQRIFARRRKWWWLPWWRLASHFPRVYGFARMCTVYMKTMKMKLGTNIFFSWWHSDFVRWLRPSSSSSPAPTAV